MKIFYISVIEQHAGWGAEYFVNKGFNSNGHETIPLDYRLHRYNLSDKFLQTDDFDVLFLQRGDGFPVKLLKSVNRPMFFWASELVARCRDQDQLLSSGLFEHIFVHSPECKKTIVTKNWITSERVSVLLNGFDETVHKKMPEVTQDIDVLFIGGMTGRRRRWLNKLKQHFKVEYAQVFGNDMATMLNRAKIAVNIHASDEPDTETRVFEVLGCGTFLITEPLSEDSPFKAGVHFIEVKNVDEMISKIDFFLQNKDIRRNISLHGYRDTKANHTYTKRAEEIAEIFTRYKSDLSVNAIDKDIVMEYKKAESLNATAFTVKDFITKVSNKILK